MKAKHAKLYLDVKALLLGNVSLSETAIADALQVKRSLIQPRCWVVWMSQEYPDIETWYLDARIPRSELNALHVAHTNGSLAIVWQRFAQTRAGSL